MGRLLFSLSPLNISIAYPSNFASAFLSSDKLILPDLTALIIDSGVATTLEVETLRADCNSTIREAKTDLNSLKSSADKPSVRATSVSYLTPAGNLPPFGAS